ncbi:7158_t:CDS:2, partial [Entrophospora sp. SA101]
FAWPRSNLQQQQTTWGPIEALSCLIECVANPKLIDEQWVLNQYKWIVWKIVSMVRNYPDLFRDWLSSEKVLDQLKYRYEREINCGHKSVIKSIIKDDASPSWPMVLCVSNIIDDVTQSISSYLPLSSSSHMSKLELTDGWYKIHACIDPPLQRAIMKYKIKIGYKLEICGACICGKPNKKTPISTTFDETTHWDSKIGIGKFRTFASLKSLTTDGGPVFAIGVIIMRKYPFMCCETNEGEVYITHNEKGEELAQGNSKYIHSVVPFFKVHREALITIWKPSSSLYNSIHEGQGNQIYSLLADKAITYCDELDKIDCLYRPQANIAIKRVDEVKKDIISGITVEVQIAI